MTGEQVHDWKYNDAEATELGAGRMWSVVRFCKECLKVQTVSLKEE